MDFRFLNRRPDTITLQNSLISKFNVTPDSVVVLQIDNYLKSALVKFCSKAAAEGIARECTERYERYNICKFYR